MINACPFGDGPVLAKGTMTDAIHSWIYRSSCCWLLRVKCYDSSFGISHPPQHEINQMAIREERINTVFLLKVHSQYNIQEIKMEAKVCCDDELFWPRRTKKYRTESMDGMPKRYCCLGGVMCVSTFFGSFVPSRNTFDHFIHCS
jgi:hypothetical protein